MRIKTICEKSGDNKNDGASRNGKVAIYTRVSTHWQVDKDSLSVQRRELIAYAEMVLGIKDYIVFEDPGYSAKNTDRPEYQHMISRLRTGEFTHLLVWKIDRISRNLLDFAGMYNELKNLGIAFVSKNEQFDTSTAIGEAMLKIILVFAELERNMTSERVSAVMLSRAANGQWNGGREPFGYNYSKQEERFVINQEEAPIIHQIFDLYEQYQSVVQVAKILNEKCIVNRNGKWNTVGIYNILTNAFYIGTYRYNMRYGSGVQRSKKEGDWVIVHDHHEPIIDSIQFDKIQYRLKRKKRGGNQKGEFRRSKYVHILSGLVVCGECGANMTATPGTVKANGVRPSVYGCSKRRRANGDCTNSYTSDATLAPFVLNYIANVLYAQKSATASTQVDVTLKRLCRGQAMQSVKNITGVEDLHALFHSGASGLEYKNIAESDDETTERKARLLSQRKKVENAITKLKDLYLYSDNSQLVENYELDYQKLVNETIAIDKQLLAIAEKESSSISMSDMQKASYLIMVKNLTSGEYVDYENIVRSIDQEVVKIFLTTVLKQIVVKNGLVMSITFSNGITQSFEHNV